MKTLKKIRWGNLFQLSLGALALIQLIYYFLRAIVSEFIYLEPISYTKGMLGIFLCLLLILNALLVIEK